MCKPTAEKLSLYTTKPTQVQFCVSSARVVEDGAKPQDFTVLYRANFQSRAIEEALLNSEISYQAVGTRFFERKEIRCALVRRLALRSPGEEWGGS